VRLFADTSALVILYDRREAAHGSLSKAFEGLQRQRLEVVVTDYVLDETLTLVLRRAGHGAAVACGHFVLGSPLVRMVQVDSKLWSEAWQMFQQYDDKAFSFTDCTSFVVMRQHRLREAFSLDHHFEQMGFRLWPR
jgi:predicted nucleic acid-binding protein